MPGSLSLWLRWTWRDLRARWPLVVAIALVIALGTGTYAAFTGSATWRLVSNDASFAALNTHDVRVRLATGTTTPQGTLLDAIGRMPRADAVTSAEERLVVPVQVEVQRRGRDLLVTGEVVGTGNPTGDEVVDDVDVSAGRALRAADAGRPVAVLERQFAGYHDLPESGRIRVSGGQSLTYVGHGQAPEQFLVTGEGGVGFFSQATWAVVYTSLGTAQQVARAPARVNDLVLTLADGTPSRAVKAELERVLASGAGGSAPVAATVTTRAEMPAHRVLYRDIDNDQKVWNVIAGLVLAGAAFAAFNLTGRVVEATRREIGVGMALGVPRAMLAVRPLLLGLQIALLGVVFGVAAGAGVSAALAQEYRTLLPLPVWVTEFQAGAFARAAALGFVLPMLAVVWPVWRAVRVEPVEAIRVGHLAGRGAGRGGGLAPLVQHIPFARSSLRRMPLRNVLRTPRRTALTALGIGAAVATLVAIFGMLDSFARTVDVGEREVTRAAPDRVAVSLTGFLPRGAPALQAVEQAPGVAETRPGLALPATVRADGHEVDVVASTVGSGALWSPSVSDGTLPRQADEILLARKAARDLGVSPGDTVLLTHPQRSGDAFRTETSSMRVAGIHPDPLRVKAYVTPAAGTTFGFAGLANVLDARPAVGSGPADVQRALFGSPVVASAQPVTAQSDALRDAVEQFVAILRVAAGVVLLLAVLIAFNASSIAVDERRRENATMLAFGVPVRGLLGMATVESALTGLLGTLVGVGVGFGVVAWVTRVLFADTVPDLGIDPALAPGTLLTALVLGVVAVALAPLATTRRLRRMDVPAALRVIE